jgi:protein-L-isoaspartate(D-aspartate) O-methyltransferase
MNDPITGATFFSAARTAMVEEQLRKRGITSPQVLQAMGTVPRHEFVPPDLQSDAYADKPLPIGKEQTISQPYIVAAMTEALELSGNERVLEIGTGTGYQTAVLSSLVREVFSVESDAALALTAQQRLTRLGYTNVKVFHHDGSMGLEEAAPYDAILVAAAAPRIPPLLSGQLCEGGRLVIPVGTQENQELLQARKECGQMRSRVVCDCRFVPLRGLYGWGRPDVGPS